MSARERLLAVATTVLVAACAGSPAQPSTATLPGTSTTPSTAPSPTADVSTTFRNAFAAMKSGILNVTGDVVVGTVSGHTTGVLTFSGSDSSDITTSSVGDVTDVSGHVEVGGKRFVRNGDGPWLEDTTAPETITFTGELARLARTATDAGVTTREGVEVHRLAPGPGASFDPLAFGFSGATNVRLNSFEFFSREDGTPTGFSIDLTWQQPQGTGTVAAHLTLQGSYGGVNAPQAVGIPEHVWPVFASKTNGFTMAYPDDYDTTLYKEVDYFQSPDGTIVGAGRDPLGTSSLNGITSAEISLIKANWKTSTVRNEAFTLAGSRARFLTWTGTPPGQKTKTTAYEAIVAHGKLIYYVWCFAAPGSEATDLVVFKQMLSTFRFA